MCQTLHFYLLGSTNGAIANGISFIRTVISIKFHGKYLGWIFLALNILWGVPMVESAVDVLPIIAACCGTFAIFFLQGIKMRLAFMTGAVCWIVNNVIVGSIGGVMLESMVLITNLITIIRLKFATKLPVAP
ncbi:YgjV family protein [Psychrosphaera algicola]|uniref:YgjV family protein n=1 Tax=Psychrosphaera algicola TaxID=3023714 RepID=A0ABT5FCK2_9GAMM|nr:YgjV family protein [Psychrosphaera sp. G1-22]MDC2888662.1 YgjV family protein [Psychrosphaera sp. G1-22]